MPASEEYQDAAEVSELLGEELVKRGQQMLQLGNRLLLQATELAQLGEGGGPTAVPDFTEERSVGKQGEVRFGMAAEAARKLGNFSRSDLGEVLGLNPGQTNKWINRLLNNKPWPVIKRSARGSYEYIGPKDKPADPTTAPRSEPDVMARAGVGADRGPGGQVIPYTGRAMGSTGKPGRDKKLSQQRRVRRKSGQIIGGRG